MPFRVLLASWAPFHAGAEVAAERLAFGLREQGHEVTVALGTEGVTLDRMRAAGLNVRYIPLALTDKFKWWRHQRAQRELRHLLLEIQPDVVHANDLPTSQMIGRAAAKLGIPRVCHHRWIFTGGAADWLNKYGAERHLFISRSIMDEMCSTAPSLADSDAAIVHDGMPVPALPSDADRYRARTQLGLPLEKRLVLFAGQLIERKGLQDLLHAWAQLSERGTIDADLLVVGEDLENQGAYRRQMELLARQLGVPARFIGFRQDVPNWIVAADICVVPSNREPFGLSVLEAMAHGRPVIGTNVGGIPEMIVDGETGLLVPPRDPQQLAEALQRLLHDAKLRSEFGQAGRMRCEERFSIERHVAAIVDQYRQVVAQHAAVSA